MADDTRPDPDRLLADVQRDEARAKRGRLRIFFGASAGVGKTFSMLEAARTAHTAGKDVVVIPVAAGADRAWWFEGWDRFLVPRPFARVKVAYGRPREVPRSAGAAELERHAAELEAELNRLVAEVDGGAAG